MNKEQQKRLVAAFKKRVPKPKGSSKSKEVNLIKQSDTTLPPNEKQWSGKTQKANDVDRLELQVESLYQFYERVDAQRPHDREHLRQMIKNYPGGAGNLAIFLDKTYQDVPDGWEGLLEKAMSRLTLGRNDVQGEQMKKQLSIRQLK